MGCVPQFFVVVVVDDDVVISVPHFPLHVHVTSLDSVSDGQIENMGMAEFPTSAYHLTSTSLRRSEMF